jgi:hypothetical protein
VETSLRRGGGCDDGDGAMGDASGGTWQRRRCCHGGRWISVGGNDGGHDQLHCTARR